MCVCIQQIQLRAHINDHCEEYIVCQNLCMFFQTAHKIAKTPSCFETTVPIPLDTEAESDITIHVHGFIHIFLCANTAE